MQAISQKLIRPLVARLSPAKPILRYLVTKSSYKIIFWPIGLNFGQPFLQDGVQSADNVSKMQTQAVFVNSPICIDVFGSLKNPWEWHMGKQRSSARIAMNNEDDALQHQSNPCLDCRNSVPTGPPKFSKNWKVSGRGITVRSGET